MEIKFVISVNGVSRLKNELVQVVFKLLFSLNGMFSNRLLKVMLKINVGMKLDVNSVQFQLVCQCLFFNLL